MSNNLANLMVGFGLDLSALQKDAPEAFRILNQQTLGMTAEMKRASREGAESFRLIDEALGIHVSRPLTRILTQEFPALATGLQSILGVGIVGALGMAVFEGFERISRSVEHAKKAEEELQSATRKSGEVFADAMQSYEKAATLRSLSGIDKKLFEVDSSAIEEGRKHIDELIASFEKTAAAAAEAHKWTTEFWNDVGTAGHQIFTRDSVLNIEATNKQLQEVERRFNELAKLDALHNTNESGKFLNEQLDQAKAKLEAMQNQHPTTLQTIDALLPATAVGTHIFTKEEVAAAQAMVNALKEAAELKAKAQSDQSGREDQTRQSEQLATMQRRISLQETYNKEVLRLSGIDLEKAHLASLQQESAEIQKQLTLLPNRNEELQRIQTEISKTKFTISGEEQQEAVKQVQAGLKEWNAEANEFQKKMAEINQFLASNPLSSPAFREPEANKQLELMLETAEAAGRVKASLSDAADRWKEFERMNGNVGGAALSPPGPPEASDTLGLLKLRGQSPQGTPIGIEAQDQALTAKAQQVVDSLESPMQKYQNQLAELQELLDHGKISHEQFTQAVANMGQQLTKAELHLQEMGKELEKLLSHSTSATDGVRAFFLELQIEAGQNGKATFDLLNQGLKGFEDELTKTVFTGKAKWEDMFRGMAESAFKFTLTKEVSGVLDFAKGTGVGKSLLNLAKPSADAVAQYNGGAPQGPAPALPPTAPGSLTGLGALAPAGGTANFQTAVTTFGTATPLFQAASQALSTGAPAFATGATAFSTGAPIFSTAASELLAAATKMMASNAIDLGPGSADQFAAGPGALFPAATNAAGTDDFAGGLSWVGEQGPELLNLPGGSSITPMSKVGSGDSVHHWHIDARGNEDVGARIVRAIALARPTIEASAMTAVQEMAKRNLRSR